MIDVSLEEPEPVFDSIVESYLNLYQRGGLVHGDLSPYNILMGDKGPSMIDFSQGTVKEGPKATNLLFRDVETLAPYFVKLGISADVRELVERISGEEGITPDETVII
jgi:serine/threonine-protein kinase RIO1